MRGVLHTVLLLGIFAGLLSGMPLAHDSDSPIVKVQEHCDDCCELDDAVGVEAEHGPECPPEPHEHHHHHTHCGGCAAPVFFADATSVCRLPLAAYGRTELDFESELVPDPPVLSEDKPPLI